MSANSQRIDDTDVHISYDPASSWELDTSHGSYGVYNNTMHTTSTTGASLSFRFTGTAISVYGLKWPTGANFTATFDSTSQGSTLSTSVENIGEASSAVIFSKDNLENKEHVLVISKAENDPSWTSTLTGDDASHLNIDYFLISGSPELPSGTSTGSDGAASSSSTSTPSTSAIPTAAIVGIVLGILAVLGLLAAFAWYRWRRNRKGQYLTDAPYDNNGVKTEVDMDETGAGAPPAPKAANPSSKAKGLSPKAAAPAPVADVNVSGEGRNRRYRNEKALASRPAELAQDPSGRGVSRWRSTLLALPGHRFLHLDSQPENAPATSTDDGTTAPYPSSPPTNSASTPPTAPSAVSSSTNPPSTAPLLGSGTVDTPSSKRTQTNTASNPHQSTENLQGRQRADSGHATTVTGMSSRTALTASLALSPSPPPISSNLSQESLRNEKSGRIGTTAQPVSAPMASANDVPNAPSTQSMAVAVSPSSANISSPGVGGTAASHAEGSSTVTNHLIQEVAMLREQVRHLTEMRHFGTGSDIHDEPPPEYRDSDESDRD